MKKKILLILLSLVIGLCVSVPAFAAQTDGFASEYERVQDLADLLSDSEEVALLEKLDELCERQKMEIVVLTTDTLEGLAPRDYADDIYDYFVLFLQERPGVSGSVLCRLWPLSVVPL